jgi:hypothetical protein
MASNSPIELTFEFRNQRFQDASKGLRVFYGALKKDWDGTAKVLSTELRSFLDSVAQALVQRHSGKWPGGTAAKTLSQRTGGMLQTIVGSVQVNGATFSTITGHIGGSMIARVQEFGAAITPKRAKFLTVPLPAALDSNGVPLKKSAREWGNTFVAKTKKGNLVIFQKRGSMIVPLYVLKTSVTIPPRLGMQNTLTAGLPYFVDRAMDRMVKAVIAAKGA